MSVNLKSALLAALALGAAACGSGSGGGDPADKLASNGANAVPEGTHKSVNLADLPAPFNEANLDNGALVFAKCRNCHSANAVDGNNTGPNLHNVFDRHPGTQKNFKYSDAMAHNPHDNWTGEELNKWLSKPKDYLPGTKMFFNGIDSPTDRRDVIAYIMIQSEK